MGTVFFGSLALLGTIHLLGKRYPFFEQLFWDLITFLRVALYICLLPLVLFGVWVKFDKFLTRGRKPRMGNPDH